TTLFRSCVQESSLRGGKVVSHEAPAVGVGPDAIGEVVAIGVGVVDQPTLGCKPSRSVLQPGYRFDSELVLVDYEVAGAGGEDQQPGTVVLAEHACEDCRAVSPNPRHA